MTKPDFVSSHDWHVQLCCQRSELLIRLSGQFWIKDQPGKASVRVLELGYAVFRLACADLLSVSAGSALCCGRRWKLLSRVGRFCELSKSTEDVESCQPLLSRCPLDLFER